MGADHDLIVDLTRSVRDFHERYERDEKRKDALRLEMLQSQAEQCRAHRDWTAAVNKRADEMEKKIILIDGVPARVDTLETKSDYIAGAGSIVSLVLIAIITAMWEKIKSKVGL